MHVTSDNFEIHRQYLAEAEKLLSTDDSVPEVTGASCITGLALQIWGQIPR
jgi:hypothetical protein